MLLVRLTRVAMACIRLHCQVLRGLNLIVVNSGRKFSFWHNGSTVSPANPCQIRISYPGGRGRSSTKVGSGPQIQIQGKG